MCLTKYVIYKRVSTTKQGIDGLGMAAQDASIDAFVKSHECKIVGSFIEVESGKKKDRPELETAIQLAQDTNSTLIIAKLDRLARNVNFISSLMESKVKFKALDLPDATDLTIHILAAVAEDEAKRISMRTRAALAAKKAKGETVGNAEIYKHAPKNLSSIGVDAIKVKADRDAEKIARGISLARENECRTLQQIANYLNELGYTTPRGKEFTATAVKRVIERTENK
ncbi:recombinase family protein [Vibrio parahaemolyticus]|nr:recombinase family protein [Vibrio parahaemolyticus]